MIKKTLILSFIAILALSAPVSAQIASQAPTTPKEVKAEPLTKKQKIESDLRSTSNKLKVAINKTQKLLDLLNKNDKDTSLAQESLDSANASLEEAGEAIDQYAGILPEINPSEKADKKSKEVVLIKEPLKKAQESLKSAKASLIESIKILKEGLAPKEGSEE